MSSLVYSCSPVNNQPVPYQVRCVRGQAAEPTRFTLTTRPIPSLLRPRMHAARKASCSNPLLTLRGCAFPAPLKRETAISCSQGLLIRQVTPTGGHLVVAPSRPLGDSLDPSRDPLTRGDQPDVVEGTGSLGKAPWASRCEMDKTLFRSWWIISGVESELGAAVQGSHLNPGAHTLAEC